MPTLTGTIERIVFTNPESGYTVARLRPNDSGRLFRSELVTLVGALPGLHPGEDVDVTGEWALHPLHGRHLRVASFVSHAPVSPTGLKRYLGSGAIRGVGPKTAERIVDHFGEQTLAILELEPERLTEVRGVGVRARDLLIAGWAAQRDIREIMVFLQGNGVPPGLAARIYQRYGTSAIGTIRENPYTLEKEVYGVGFKTADALATSLGLPRDGVPRFMAGVKHVLSQAAATDGHCYLPRDELLLHAAALLEQPREAIEPALAALRQEQEIFVEEQRVYLAPFFHAERGAARRLQLLLATPSTLPPVAEARWRATFAALERERGMRLAERQRTAVRLAYGAKVMVLTGGPGVGKTTTLRALLDVLDGAGVDYALAAPTGRAAKRMTEATGRPASTLHRLLEYLPGKNAFGYDEHRPLPRRFVIVDEASMLDILLAYRLLRAIHPAAHLLLVGDADQLPSVGPGNVLGDVLASAAIPRVHLTELFRQGRESGIILTAHAINAGQVPPRRAAPHGDFFFVAAADPVATQRALLELVAQRLPGFARLDPISEIQVLTPTNRGPAGVHELNLALQQRLNPQPARQSADGRWRVGDKVTQIRNNYDRGPGGIFNGDLGRICEIDDAGRLAVRFGDEQDAPPVLYEPHETDELMLAYACSIHRAQGSEYPCVVVPLVMQHYLLLQRNLIYTAITRARRLCVVVGQWRAFQRAVENDVRSARNTGLAARLGRAAAGANPDHLARISDL